MAGITLRPNEIQSNYASGNEAFRRWGPDHRYFFVSEIIQFGEGLRESTYLTAVSGWVVLWGWASGITGIAIVGF